jgi:hypothetical protein
MLDARFLMLDGNPFAFMILLLLLLFLLLPEVWVPWARRCDAAAFRSLREEEYE